MLLGDPKKISDELDLLAAGFGALGLCFIFQALRGVGLRGSWVGKTTTIDCFGRLRIYDLLF
ncbi:MAG: hypothetical protein JW936_06030 [Sedimentisphaerales bacterium]|nr:hypothetical protein [Sedimentisphaerales bacterium]